MEPEGPLSNSQKSAIVPYCEPGEFRPCRTLYLPKVNVNFLLQPTRGSVK